LISNDEENPFVQSFFYLYTAAALGHSRARSQLAVIYFQNGLLPSKEILRNSLFGANVNDIEGSFAFLQFISPDILKLINDEPISEVEYMKHTAQSQSMLLLYLASQMKVHRPTTEDSLISTNTNIYKMKPHEEVISEGDILEFK
jgi:hypothetical protein